MIGKMLGTFLIESKIGAGAMGEVFKATQTLKNGQSRTSAVKIISGEFALRDNALRRFQREAAILAQLRHPHIVRYFAHGKYQGTWYYAMEFVDGTTLDKHLQKREFLPWREVVELGRQLCDALYYAHGHQVVHRDLKPSNLMVLPDGSLKLTDFGIAKDLEASVALTKTGRTLGTAAYMAPEQIRGEPPISHKTDLYALGCLLYEMLTGQPPFLGKSAVELMHMHMSTEPPRPSSKTPDVPKALDDLVVQLMSKNPPERPWDAQLVSDQLAKLAAKADRGETVPMAFDKARAKVAAEEEAVTNPGRTRSGATKAVKKPKKGPLATFDEGAGTAGGARRTLELVGLVTGLVALLGVLAYIFWPPGQEYLHRKAAELMKTERRADWRRADKEYLQPLDRRFPDHPYKEEVRGWRDQLAYEDAKERALRLAGSGLGSKPLNHAEELYQAMHRRVQPLTVLEEQGRIKREYDLFLSELRGRDDPDERGWVQVARKLAEDQEAVLEAVRSVVRGQLEEARILVERDRPEEAIDLLQRLIARQRTTARGDEAMSRLLAEAEALLGEVRQAAEPDAAP